MEACNTAQVINANDLQIFLAVARHGRLTLAAKSLGIDHTTVGRRVSALERSIGSRLFHRDPQGWLLTPAGQELLGPAETIDSAVAVAQERVGRQGVSLTGTVRVVAPDGFGAFLMAPALRHLHSAHVELVVELITANSHQINSIGDFDVSINLHEPTSPRAVHRHLTDYFIRLYATPEYIASSPPLESEEDLKNHVVIWHVDRLLVEPHLRHLHRMLKAPANLQSTNLVAHWQAAAASVGIAPLPQFMAASDPRLVPVLPEIFFRGSYWLSLRPEHSNLGRVKAVVQMLDQVVREREQDLIGAL
jgi:DNA-binding transcriptional LysR family regulator